MIATILGATVRGVTATLVRVEVDLIGQLPSFTTVGLAEGAVRESKERVRSAIQNAGYKFPARRITVNLAPADLPKGGTGFDLPIAVGILLEAGIIGPERLGEYLLAGELSLDGQLRPIRGALPLALAAREAGLTGVILPRDVAAEAAVVEGLTVRAASSLREVVDFLNDDTDIPVAQPAVADPAQWGAEDIDLSDVAGQAYVKRALEIAAAGGHNLLMIGPPGSGKSMVARRLTTILPSMSFEESLETTLVYSVLGLVPAGTSLIHRRPFRAPHHTISDAGLVGGGTGPTPGEVSLAHHGVLFLDELPEFRRSALEVLRQPLEDGTVTLARAAGALTYPARIMLVATMNPCPCGHLGDRTQRCACSATAIERYRGRLSGPLLDRIDLHIEVPALPWKDLRRAGEAERSADVRARVEAARRRQRERYAGLEGPPIHCNAQLSPRQLRRVCAIGEDSQRLLERAIEGLGLSARAYARILKVARTIADMEGSGPVEPRHVAEAVQYRLLDRGRPARPSAHAPEVRDADEGDEEALGRPIPAQDGDEEPAEDPRVGSAEIGSDRDAAPTALA